MSFAEARSLSHGAQSSEALADDGMLYVPGGTYRMGSDHHYPEEAPVHRVTVDGFWIDRTPVPTRKFPKSWTAPANSLSADWPPGQKTYRDPLRPILRAGRLSLTPPR